MAYRIIFTKAVRRQIEHLPGNLKPILRERIATFGSNPRPSDSKELDEHPTYYRVWLNEKYRLVWRIFDEDATVEIVYAGPKTPDLYESLGLGRFGD